MELELIDHIRAIALHALERKCERIVAELPAITGYLVDAIR